MAKKKPRKKDLRGWFADAVASRIRIRWKEDPFLPSRTLDLSRLPVTPQPELPEWERSHFPMLRPLSVQRREPDIDPRDVRVIDALKDLRPGRFHSRQSVRDPAPKYRALYWALQGWFPDQEGEYVDALDEVLEPLSVEETRTSPWPEFLEHAMEVNLPALLGERTPALLRFEELARMRSAKSADGLVRHVVRAEEEVETPPVIGEEARGDVVSSNRPKPKSRGGRKRESDPREDRKIAEAWRTRKYRTYAELASFLRKTKREVSLALDRYRHRRSRRSPE